ncbi:glutathione S-transferase t2-like protein [Trifolium pratense]|uniref:Glutathione S-transferase t2-like protein n=1 Tax=Trifolium pratense TaxID=57577 RepID=A0A2K3NGK5_TRIPR|nr:glutathione S-transferase t2-like protein [Trifolium pratense]
MDPSQYHYQSYMNLLQNQPPPPAPSNTSHNPQYLSYPAPPNSNMLYRPPMGSSSGMDVPQYSTQIGPEPQLSAPIGLESISIDEEKKSTEKKPRVGFTQEEDTLLLQSWLNVSKDSVVGNDQKAEGFWLRITQRYNNYRDKLRPREMGQLKSRYHRLNGRIQQFSGCYKAAANLNKSGQSENDILIEAHRIYAQDAKRKFVEVQAWRLLKDEPKWKGSAIESCSKRSKVSSCGGYTSSNPGTPTASSNPGTPIDSSDYEQISPIARPMGQKAAKRKSVLKETSSSINVDLTTMENVATERNGIMLRIAEAREKEAIAREKEATARELEAKARAAEAKAREDETEAKWYEILFKDTSTMNERQLQDHEFYCNHIREKLGMK